MEKTAEDFVSKCVAYFGNSDGDVTENSSFFDQFIFAMTEVAAELKSDLFKKVANPTLLAEELKKSSNGLPAIYLTGMNLCTAS